MTTIDTQTDSSNNVTEALPNNIKWFIIDISVGVGAMIPLCPVAIACVYRNANKKNKTDTVRPFTPPTTKEKQIRINENQKKPIRR
jgi:hypothetical protein